MSKIKELYKQIWEERQHRCAVCGYRINIPIESVPSHCFSHVFSKGAHPSLKYEPKNIEIWCSTIIRLDDRRGCHELHHTKPKAFKERAMANGYQKPNLQSLKQQVNQPTL
jgi:5-methylcytosine-specific restriction endonuclease McrA